MTCPTCKGDNRKTTKCKVCKYYFNTYETDEDLYFKLNKKEKNND